MDSLAAFAMGEANRGKPLMVFDWDRAAALIRDAKPTTASAGLEGDWEWTGGTIFRNGHTVPADDTYTYLSSTWATPQLDMDGEVVDCWRYEDQTPGWGSGTYWPLSAVGILNGDAK